MKKKVVLALLFSLLPLSAQAATSVKMVGLKPTTTIQLSQNPHDQVFSLFASPSSITVVGTSDGDGFITAYDRSGTTVLWSTKLGGSLDDIATAASKDALGDIWVAGASAVQPDAPSAPTIPTGTLNPSGVLPDTSTALPQLKQLDIWKINSKGVISKSFNTIMNDVIYPTAITVKAGKATVTGSIASQAFGKFTISADTAGKLGVPKLSSVNPATPIDGKEIKTTLSIWKSFTTSVSIKGLPSWKPKPNSHVLVRYDAKTKAVLAAYVTSGEILDIAWEKSIGIIALLNYPTGYAIAVVR